MHCPWRARDFNNSSNPTLFTLATCDRSPSNTKHFFCQAMYMQLTCDQMKPKSEPYWKAIFRTSDALHWRQMRRAQKDDLNDRYFWLCRQTWKHSHFFSFLKQRANYWAFLAFHQHLPSPFGLDGHGMDKSETNVRLGSWNLLTWTINVRGKLRYECAIKLSTKFTTKLHTQVSHLFIFHYSSARVSPASKGTNDP